jgi:2-octaprenyl-6-methoxyphenol hydroxylase
MKKQKICIIGGGLTGLVTAISLSKLNCKIDLITENNSRNTRSSRTIAISENNFDFFEKLSISKTLKSILWPCSVMQLYTADEKKNFSKIFEFNNNKKKEKILYMVENFKLNNILKEKIKKIKSISIIKHKKITKIKTSGLLKSIKINNKELKYNLIIICTGSNSNLVKGIFRNETIENSYEELSITTILKHDKIDNNISRQVFLDNEILALLPVSKTETSIVWSVKKNKKINNLFFKKKIKFYTKDFLKNIKFYNKIEYKDLNFLIRKRYFIDRTLLFGDALHMIHPFAGQGFNMILRDLSSLVKILGKKINLGLDIGSLDILSEFSKETKSTNFAFSFGLDVLKNSFDIKNTYLKNIRNNVIKNLNRNELFKNIFFNIANKGLKF